MRRVVLLVGVVAMAMALGVGSASAFTGGGRAPSEAPLLAWGAHYEGTLGNKEGGPDGANYLNRECCGMESSQVAIWHLGSLGVHDQVVVNWHELPFAGSSHFPVRMIFVENVSDFDWGDTFGDTEDAYEVSGSGTARTEITVKNSSANDYLEFYSSALQNNSQEFETYPYDFSVEAPRHYLSISLASVNQVAANGTLHATATLATGAPVPDGYPVTLTGTWSGGGVFTTAATTVAGQVTFQLAMPESSLGRDVEFVASSAATAEYQGVTSSKVYAEVTKPPAPPAPAPVKAAPVKKPKPAPNLCLKATNKAHTLARLYKRQLKDAGRVRGRHRRLLLHRAHATERKFLAARTAKKAAC
jgi:hypothetical protein